MNRELILVSGGMRASFTPRGVPAVDLSALVDRSSSLGARTEVGERMCQLAHEVGLFYVHGHSIPDAVCSEVTLGSVRGSSHLGCPAAHLPPSLHHRPRGPRDPYHLLGLLLHRLLRHFHYPEARDRSAAFFRLPAITKEAISIRHSPRLSGYQAVGENVTMGARDQHEAVDFYRDMLTPDFDGHVAMGLVDAPLGSTNYGLNQWPAEGSPGMAGFRPFFERYTDGTTSYASGAASAAAAARAYPPPTHALHQQI